MTNDPRAQSQQREQSDVEWLRDLARGYANAGSIAPELSHLLAIADALEALTLRAEAAEADWQAAEKQLDASRAENAALAKLVDEWIEIYRKIGDGMPILCDDVVRRCVALRAGQQKGER